ncbi:MAG: 50S ribosomal protein L4 [Candidatus Hydrothermarchaeaceae archaeon]
MKVGVYSLKGKKVRQVNLPSVFEDTVRTDLIKRAVISAQSRGYQRKGVDWYAGKRTSAFSWGPGHGVSRVPRIKGSGYPAGGRGAIVPQAVGGRSAHPPKAEKRIVKKINNKERRKAIASAIAATAKRELVEKRGHVVKVPQIPLVVVDDLEKLKRAKEVRKAFVSLGVWGDVLRASVRRIRAGKGRKRGRKYKTGRSVLVAVFEDRGIKYGARNHPGVDVVTVNNLSVEDLAPGTHAGRLTIYTESAVKGLGERFTK